MANFPTNCYILQYQDFFVNFIGWYETDKHVCIAMELHELGSLDNYLLPTQASLPESEVKVIMAQVLKALDYMHELDFMHRDLKPAVCYCPTTVTVVMTADMLLYRMFW